MTNQPTDNEWIDDLYDIAVLDRSLYRNEFRHYIEDNLSKPTEVVAPVDIDLVEDIMEDVHNQSCIIRWDRAYIDLNTLKMILAENISKVTTPVEPINQESDDPNALMVAYMQGKYDWKKETLQSWDGKKKRWLSSM